MSLFDAYHVQTRVPLGVIAARYGRYDILRWLLVECCTKLSISMLKMSTRILFEAVQRYDDNIVAYLIECGADLTDLHVCICM